jgi:hypothetical protein
MRRNAGKKMARSQDRAEDSTIGGEWRNAPAVPKEETAGPRTGISMQYCGAQCKMHKLAADEGRPRNDRRQAPVAPDATQAEMA